MFIDRGMDKEDVVHKYMVHRSLLTKQKLSHRCRKQICGYQRKKVGGAEGINCETESDIYILLYIE